MTRAWQKAVDTNVPYLIDASPGLFTMSDPSFFKLGGGANGNIIVTDGSGNLVWDNPVTFLSPYFLPLTGGTLTGPVTINSTLNVTGQTTLAGATATTPAPGDNSTAVATTAWVGAHTGAAGGPFLPVAGGTLEGPLTINSAPGDPSLTASGTVYLNGQTFANNGLVVIGPTQMQAATATTPPPNDNSTNVATTAWVGAHTGAVGGPFLALTGGTLSGLLTANGGVTVAGQGLLSNSLQVTGPTLLGTAQATTPPVNDNSINVATTAWVTSHIGGATGFLPLSGGTLTGSLIIDAGVSDVGLHVYSPSDWWAGIGLNVTNATFGVLLRANRNGLARWLIYLGDDTVESGGNSGTNFQILRYDDTGNTLLGTPLTINRATGLVTIASEVIFGADIQIPNGQALFSGSSGGGRYQLIGSDAADNVDIANPGVGSVYFKGANGIGPINGASQNCGFLSSRWLTVYTGNLDASGFIQLANNQYIQAENASGSGTFQLIGANANDAIVIGGGAPTALVNTTAGLNPFTNGGQALGGTSSRWSALYVENIDASLSIKMANSQYVVAENAAGSGTFTLIGVNANDAIVIGGGVASTALINTAAGLDPYTNGAQALGGTNSRWSAIYLVNAPDVSSDPRLKRDITALPEDCLGLLGEINPIRFRWIDPAPGYEGTRWGFNALEIKEVMDRHEFEFGGVRIPKEAPASLAPDQLIAVLWKAVQELTLQVKHLEALCARLQ